MMANKWNATKASSQATQACVNKKEKSQEKKLEVLRFLLDLMNE